MRLFPEWEQQVPLSLRFQDGVYFDAVKERLSVSDTGAAICLALFRNAAAWTSYSRRKNHYVRPSRYRDQLYTYAKVVPQIDLLERNLLVEHARQKPGGRGWQSSVKPTTALLDVIATITAEGRPAAIAPAELIWLRDECGQFADYSETRERDRMRRRAAEINEMVLSAELNMDLLAPLVRIFNINFNRGGRFYAMGPSWQNIKSDMREQITIGGEPVVELDFKTLHPALLYAQTGAAMPDDCYAIDGWPRDLVKVALLTLINAANYQQARHSIAHSDGRSNDPKKKPRLLMDVLAEPGSNRALSLAAKLIKNVAAAHTPISWAFHSDKGAELMLIDARIAETVMLLMARRGIVVLPVHDSFLVPARSREILEETMVQAAFEVAKLHARVEWKGPDPTDTPTHSFRM